MPITALPSAPVPGDTPSQFNTKAFALVAALAQFVSETNALATTVDSDKTTATTQAGIATTQAGTATTQAGVATTQAGIATTQAGNAAASAALAASLIESYQGALATDPALDRNGNALVAGDWYVNTSTGFIRAYTGSAWVNGITAISGVSSVNGVSGAVTNIADLSSAQTLTNKTLTDPAMIGTILEDVFTITDAAAFEIDPGNGSIQLITLGANRTPKGTNFAAGEAVTLMVDDGTARTLTWTDTTFGTSGVVWKTDGGVAPTLNTTGYTVIVLWKVGTQVYGARVGDA